MADQLKSTVDLKELRIGNFLKDRKDQLCRVTRVDVDIFDASAVIGPFTYLSCEPIELNKEWLVRLGFKFNPREGYQLLLGKNLPNKRLYIPLDPHGEARIVWRDSILTIAKGIFCVHQLQNLVFAMTGQELKLLDTASKVH